LFSEKFSLRKTFAESYNPLCIGNPGPPKLYGTRKVAQLTGDTDPETNKKTFNKTATKFSIYGTDLGVSFPYDGKLYFLFGDTTRRGPLEGLPKSAMPGAPYNEDVTDYDAIAFTTSDRAYDGIMLEFNSSPPLVDDISQLTAEHPIEGITIGEDMYVFFTTDLNPNRRIMPRRTVLAKSTDGGYKFGNSLYTLSTGKFIHISAQIVDNDKIYGLPQSNGKGLLLWGTGKYRESDIYLAYMPLDEITVLSSIRYYAGLDTDSKKPLWNTEETFAKPLFSASCIGELSVRWNYYLDKWILLYNCDLCNTNGIVIRLADDPWGPWSTPKIVFDPADGYGQFVHQPRKDELVDKERDDPTNPFDLGYGYGPYQMAPYATGVKGRYSKIYFTLSTWNPYQVIQMSAIVLSEEEEKNPTPYAKDVKDRNDRKYAYISVLIAHLANAKKITFHNAFGNNPFIADHIEWAQFHTHLELRNELKIKINQLITSLAADIDKADVYTAIASVISRLGYDYNLFNNTVNAEIYRRWALDAVHTGNKNLLIDEINKRIESGNFLPNHDDLCYAYGSEDSNEFKYAKISLLEARLGEFVKMNWDLEHQGKLDCVSHITWARFRHIDEMRGDLVSKFRQLILKYHYPDGIVNMCKELHKAIMDLSGSTIQYKNASHGIGLALTKINQADKDAAIEEITRVIYSDRFLKPIPTNNIPK
jgi:hypothetical protein